MKSSIKIDFIDRGTGRGIEPVIRVEIIKSEDPRDTLVAVLFESLNYQRFLEFTYSNCKQVATSTGLPDMERTALLFKPEINTDELFSIVMDAFNNWLGEEKYTQQLGSEDRMMLGDVSFTKDELFKKFVSIKAVHTNS